MTRRKLSEQTVWMIGRADPDAAAKLIQNQKKKVEKE